MVALGGHRHALDLEDHVARGAGLLLHMEVDVAAHHHGGQLLHRHVLRVDGADVFALAQHGAAVGHRHDLRELMGDKQDALPLGGEIFHDLHELVDLLGGEHCRRLVENQDLIVAVEHFQDLGALLHTDGDILNEGVRVDGEAVFFRQSHDLFSGLVLLEKTRLVRLHTKDDVVEHREALDQLEMLVHHADAEIVGIVGVFDLDFLAVLFDGALLGLIKTEQNAHQRGFACAVLAQQGMNFALFELERDIVVGDDTGETLRDVKHFNCVGTVQAYRPPVYRFAMVLILVSYYKMNGV